MLPRRTSTGRGGRLDVEAELSRPLTFVLVFFVMVLVPLGSYFYLHKSLTDKYIRLEKHMMAEMKEVTRLKHEVAGLTRIKDSLRMSSSALKTALRSFGRPLPEGLNIEIDKHVPLNMPPGSVPTLGSGDTTTQLDARQQGYIFVPKDTTVRDCTPDSSVDAAAMPIAYSLFFQQRKLPGVFVELGAGDGVYQSKTYYLEKALCWTGIVVEPTNSEFPRLMTERARSIAVHGAACPKDNASVGDFLDVTLNGVWTGWSGFTNSFSQSHQAAIQAKTAPGNQDGWQANKMSVACFKLKTLLQRQQISHVDYMHVSVQGAELDVLKEMDHSAVGVDVLEVDVSSSLKELKAYLESVGYRFHSQHGTRGHIFIKVGVVPPRGGDSHLTGAASRLS